MSVIQASAVAIEGRALLVSGPPGSGKSSLAMALIDRGAVLIGDDGVTLALADGALLAAPPPHTAGLLEVRGLGLLRFPLAPPSPVRLFIELVAHAPRFIDRPATKTLLDTAIPAITLEAHDPLLAIKAELALDRYGLVRAAT